MRIRSRVRPAATALALIVVLVSAPTARAGLIPIGTVEATAPDSFIHDNTGINATLTASAAVTFRFADGLGLSTADQAATLTLLATSLTPAASGGGMAWQAVDGATNLLSITRNSDGANLLSMSFTGTLFGSLGTPNAALAGSVSSGQIVNFSSDFLDFATTTDRSFLLTLPTSTPSLTLGAAGFLDDFRSASTGSFHVDGTPTLAGGGVVPEPSAAMLLMGGLASVALAIRERRRLAPSAA